MTPTEKRIISYLVKGHSNRRIAEIVGTTEGCVKNYFRNVFDKLGMDSRLQVALWALEHPEKLS